MKCAVYLLTTCVVWCIRNVSEQPNALIFRVHKTEHGNLYARLRANL